MLFNLVPSEVRVHCLIDQFSIVPYFILSRYIYQVFSE